MSSIKKNQKVKLVLSDVDETIADLYLPASRELISELIDLLRKGKCFFFISGQGLNGIKKRITDLVPIELRKQILIAHCSGSEVWGFDPSGKLLEKPYYSVYDISMGDRQKLLWRKQVDRVVEEFKLKKHETMPVSKFNDISKGDPLSIMYEDRGPQITLEVVNGVDLEIEQVKSLEMKVPETHGAYDIRIPIAERADDLFIQNKIPVTSRLGGEFAIDFAIKGVSKESAVRFVLESEQVLSHIGISKNDLKEPDNLEIWGDKFSVIRGGTDRHMCEAVSPKVRAIDFRIEDPEEFPKAYNIVMWDGEKHLQDGVLEYLRSK